MLSVHDPLQHPFISMVSLIAFSKGLFAEAAEDSEQTNNRAIISSDSSSDGFLIYSNLLPLIKRFSCSEHHCLT